MEALNRCRVAGWQGVHDIGVGLGELGAARRIRTPWGVFLDFPPVG